MKSVLELPSSFVQLDIFSLLSAVEEPQEMKMPNAISPDTLIVGDVVDFVSYGGESMRGIFVTKGFWDGRDQAEPQYYYFEVDGRFIEINPKCCYWARIGHDDDYVKPSKDDIVEKLIEYFKGLAFPNRLSAYRSFESEYPYLSYEYHPYVSEAWDKAIVEVTTMNEVMSNLKHWSNREKFPKNVKQELIENVLPLSGSERLQEMFVMEWQEPAWKEGGVQVYYKKRFAQKTYSVYEPLFKALIEQATSERELVTLASLWGTMSSTYKESEAE